MAETRACWANQESPIELKHIANQPVSFALEVGRLPKVLLTIPLRPRVFTKEKGEEAQVRRDFDLAATKESGSNDREWCVRPTTRRHRFVLGLRNEARIESVRKAHGEKVEKKSETEEEVCYHVWMKSDDGAVGSVKAVVELVEYELRPVEFEQDRNWLPRE